LETVEKPSFNPYLAVVLAVLAMSLASIFIRLSTAHPLIIAFYRMAFTVLVLAPFALAPAERKELLGMSRRDMATASLAGLFLAIHFTVWNTSLEYTTVASSTVLVTMQPLFVVTLGYIFLKEKISPKSMAGAALALTGSILVGAGDFQIGGESPFRRCSSLFRSIFYSSIFLDRAPAASEAFPFSLRFFCLWYCCPLPFYRQPLGRALLLSISANGLGLVSRPGHLSYHRRSYSLQLGTALCENHGGFCQHPG
jgi:drug/metabolite transporter (DMT)-like permease